MIQDWKPTYKWPKRTEASRESATVEMDPPEANGIVTNGTIATAKILSKSQ